ncbi:hypothetical protein ACFQS6_05160 [Xanthomonas populi]|uniref:hypothetical protein n=1 Tax=Xanthomonas populi TaxID=53414 RepID=UPI000FF8B1FF|nr:hypothetical protein [Xanthomonas populi]
MADLDKASTWNGITKKFMANKKSDKRSAAKQHLISSDSQLWKLLAARRIGSGQGLHRIT